MMQTGDIRRAKFWLQRWRAIGGGFMGAIEGGDLNVTRRTHDDPKLEAAYAKAEAALVKELKADTRKRDNVFHLVREAAAGRLVPADDGPIPANDQEEPDPAA